jgi:predicted aldo/keto reductase-like oxidoreductase
MSRWQKLSGMNRREFLHLGLVGTTSTLLGGNALAEAVEGIAQADAFRFPAPVYRTLGRTGLKVSVVGFGAMLTPEPEVIRVAFEHGVNYVNTSRKYMAGKNEEIVGKALQGFRDKVFVATKIQTELNTKEAIIRDVEASLKALGTDHIDVIQLDANADKDRIFRPEPREAFTRLKEQGKVRFCGAAVHKNPADVVNALADDKSRFFDTVMVSYNFKSGKELTEAIARAAKTGLGIIAMKTQTGGYAPAALGGVSPHQAALKWVLSNPDIAVAIPGMKDLVELKENIAVMGLPLRAADQHILRTYGTAVQPYYCHLCGACEGNCPRGVEISTINRSLMYAEGYRNPDLARATYRELPASATAAACLDCPACTARCINGLDIAAKMAQARHLLT